MIYQTETPNCFTDCFFESITVEEEKNFMYANEKALEKYKQDLGTIEYDDRKL